MKTIFKALCIITILGLALGLSPIKPVAAESVVPVYVLDPSWDAAGGGGVFSAYVGPADYDYVSPGSIAYYSGREAGIIKAGLAVDPTSGHFEDEGIFGFKPTVTIDVFAAGSVNYDVITQAGVNPVWMTIEIDTGVIDDRNDNVTYQHVPTSNPAGWHTVNAAAGLWAKWDDNDGTVTTTAITLAEVATNYTGCNVVRAYLRLGMGDSYNNGGTGTYAWVDQATLGGFTYDFQLTHPFTWWVSPTGSDSNFGTEASPFLTIQKAIDASTNGDAINVAAGTYDSFSIVGKTGLTISGAGDASTFIEPTSLITTGVGHKYTANILASVFVNVSTDVSIQGMTIKSTLATPGSGGADAIVFWNASTGSINESIIQGLYTINGAQTGQGLAVDAGAGQTTVLNLTNTDINGIQKNAIDVVDGNSTTPNAGTITLNVTGGSINGAGPTSTIAQNGIMFWNKGGGTLSGTISGVNLSGFNYTPTGNDASGILNFGLGSGTLSISGSTFTGIELPIYDNQGVLDVDSYLTTNTFEHPVTISGGPGIFSNIQAAFDESDTGDIINIYGTHVLGSGVINVNKAVTFSCDPAARIQVSGTTENFNFSAIGASLEGCDIEKTDNAGNIIYIGADDVSLLGNTMHGQWSYNLGDVSRAMTVTYGITGLIIEDNTIYSLRQPAYINGSLASPTTGNITNNFVYATRGWVIDGANMSFSGNRWGTGANANAVDIAILAATDLSYYTDIPAISAANNSAVIEDQRVSPALLSIVYVDGSVVTSGDGTARSPKKTIAEGVARVVPGGQVIVAAGTYTENLSISKALTLQGVDGLVAKLVGQVGITASNVTIDGMDISNPGQPYGILITTAPTNITITNNKIHDIGSNVLATNVKGIYFPHGADNLLIEGNIFDNIQSQASSAQAINSGDSNSTNPNAGIVIRDNDFTNIISALKGGYGILLNNGAGAAGVIIDGNRFSAITGKWTHAIGLEGPTPGAVVTNNTFSALTTTPPGSLDNAAVFLEDNPSGGSVRIEDNKFNNASGGVLIHPDDVAAFNYSVDASPNWWGTVAKSLIQTKVYGSVTYEPYWLEETMEHLSSSTVTPVYVDDNYTLTSCGGHLCGYDAFTTIQEGIAAVSNGGTVHVAAGTYVESGQIVLNKNVTIIGEDKVTTIIKPAADTGASGDTRAFILVNSGVTFNLSNVTIDGLGRLVNIGILSHGPGTIENNILMNIGYNPSGPDYAGRGIAFYDANMTIRNNLLQNIGRIGIYMYGTGVSAAVIDGNIYQGKGVGNWLDYGIEIEGGAVAEVMNNTISDCKGIASVDGSSSAGLLITTYFSGGATANIHDNTFSNNSVGIAVGYGSTDTSTVTAEDNKFLGNDYGISSTNPTVDADRNYWGTVFKSGIQTQISGAVLFEPYWLDEPMTILSGTLVTPVFVDDDFTSLVCGGHVCGVDAFNTVQDGVAAVSAGGVVNVAAGNYNVPTTIALNKALTLAGPTTGTAKVIGTGTDMFKVFTITSGNVVIQDFEITLAVTPAYPLLVSDELNSSLISIPSGSAMTGIVIQNNEIYVPVQALPMTGWSGRAITVGSNTVSGISISGNTIYNTRNGIVIHNNNSATLTGNTIYNTKGGIMNYTGSNADADNRVMTNNTWTSAHNEWDIVWNSGTYYAPDYTGDILPVSVANNEAYVLDRRGPDAATVTNLTSNRSHVFVSTSGTTTIHPANGNINLPYAKIQDGITAVVPGGKVIVAAGTYPEKNILINKSLTLLGDPGDAVAGPGVNAPVIDGGSAYGDAFKLANGVSNITIQGFEIRNYATLADDFDGVGNAISAWVGSTSNITIRDNYFHDLEYNAILVGNDYNSDPAKWGDHTNWLVTKNITDNCGYIGFELTNTSNSIISDNIIHLDTPYIGAIFSSARRSESGLTISNNLIDGTPSTGFPVIYVYAYDNDMPNPNLDNVLIEGNTINTTGTPYQIYVRNLYTGTVTGVQIEDNKLTSLKNLTGETIDASPNWWGTINKATILSKISGDVIWEPFWLDEGMTTLSGAVPTVYVDDDYTSTVCGGHLCGYDAFSTIQKGIAGVDVGGTVNVAAGTYAEDLSINKAVSLLGPNASIDPNSGTRVAEAIVIPASSNPDTTDVNCTVLTYLGSSNITVKGFTFNGDNPAFTSGVTINGGDVDVCEIIAAWDGIGNTVVENNILKYATYTAMEFYNWENSGGATSGNFIRYNLIQDIGETTYDWGIGVLLYNNFYAEVTDNVFDAVRVGIQTGNYFQANPGTTGSISNNEINTWRLGIWQNLWYSNASTITISDNTINAVTYPGADKWNGMLVSSIDGSVNTIISDNDIVIPGTITFPAPGYTAGYNVWNTNTTAPLTISGGSVTGGDHGVFVNNYEGYSSNANNTSIILSQIRIDGAAIAGISIWDSPLNTNGAFVTAELDHNVITHSTQGVLVTGTDATSTGRHNQITNNSLGVKNEVPVTLDLEENWWGSALKTDFQAQIDGSVDYNPWCGNPECTTMVYEVTPGFTIQGAIDAASAGDTINVAAGTYPEQITITKSLTLIGAGEGTTTIISPATRALSVTQGANIHDYLLAAYALSGTIDVRVEGFTLDVNGLNKTTGTARLDGVFFRDVKDTGGSMAGLFASTIHNFAATPDYESWGVAAYGDSLLTLNDNTISDYTRDGVLVVGGNVTISNNTVTGSATPLNGINIQDVTAGAITGNTVTGHTRSDPWAAGGIVTWASTGLTISGNHVNGNFYGIDLLDGSDNNIVQNNVLTDNIKRAITLDNSDNNTVSGNVITGPVAGTDDVGIALVNNSTGNTIGGDTLLAGNSITMATSGTGNLYAVHMQADLGTATNTIRYNTITGGKRGVQFDGPPGVTGLTTVANNVISGQSFGGITAYNNGSLVITNNSLTNTVRPLEFFGPVNLTVTGNTIDGSSFAGINLGAFTGTATVSGNTVHNIAADQNGIWAQTSGAGLAITGNTIYDISATEGTYGGRGIQIDASADNVTINGNEVYNITGFAAIVIDNGATGAVISNNYLHNNIQGIAVNEQTAQFDHNRIQNNRWGIDLNKDGANFVLFHNIISGNNTNPADSYGLGVWAGTVNAEANWWGSRTGPGGIGDVLYGSADYSPWCGDAACTFLEPVILGEPYGTKTTFDEIYRWTGTTTATYYIVEVSNPDNSVIATRWVTPAQANCSTGTDCSTTSLAFLDLADGDYKWRVLDYGAYGYGLYTPYADFTLDLVAEPVVSVLGQPAGTKTSFDNIYHWTGIPSATWYIVEVSNSAGTVLATRWVTPVQANCPTTGLGCYTNALAFLKLSNGNYKWRVLDYGAYGYGNWTEFTNFTVAVPATPPMATTISPAGTLTSFNGTYTWTGNSTATWYILEVSTSTGTVLATRWVTPAQAGCPTGTGCTSNALAFLNLGNGSYRWRVLNYGAYGYGAWTGYTTFTLNIPAPLPMATITSPVGPLASFNGTYTWTGNPTATYYILEVSNADTNTVLATRWVTSAQAGCPAGTGCTSTSLAFLNLTTGNYKWRVLNYGAYGYGAWTAYSGFTIQ